MTDINIDGVVTWLSNWFQDKLISGTNIKTINNQSLLGSGNISVGGSGGGLSFDDVYPVGAIYMSINNTNPSELFGGTWEQIKDKFLLACGDTYANGATGGSANVSLTVSQMPRHNHATNAHSHNTKYSGSSFVVKENSTGASNKRVTAVSSGSTYVDTASAANFHNYNATDSQSPTTKYSGGTGTSESASNGSAHENMPPYIACYIWRRTA